MPLTLKQQKELAEKATVSLRTIQRIESGITNPYGHTLNQIAGALETSLESLGKNRSIDSLRVLNLSALAVILIPYSNLILPIIFYYRLRSDPAELEVGKRIINFHLNWVLICSIWLAIIPFVYKYVAPDRITHAYPGVLPSYILFVTYNVSRTLHAARKIGEGTLDAVFPRVIRLF